MFSSNAHIFGSAARHQGPKQGWRSESGGRNSNTSCIIRVQPAFAEPQKKDGIGFAMCAAAAAAAASVWVIIVAVSNSGKHGPRHGNFTCSVIYNTCTHTKQKRIRHCPANCEMASAADGSNQDPDSTLRIRNDEVVGTDSMLSLGATRSQGDVCTPYSILRTLMGAMGH